MRALLKILLYFMLYNGNLIAAPKFLTLSDIHYSKVNYSSDGHDTGPDFFKVMLKKYTQLHKKVDFILFLGDIPAHQLFFNNDKIDYETLVFHELFLHDTEQKPLFYIPGNNDSLPGNYQPFANNGISPLTYAYDWQGACAHCHHLIIDNKHMYDGGYYSSYTMQGNKDIILVVLNATQFTKVSWYKKIINGNYANQDVDAQIQLMWFKKQLQTLHAKQLLIAMHEPPGYSYLGESIWHDKHLKQFVKVIAQYRHSFGEISLLHSHTHMEEFRRVNLDKKSAVFIYSTPSISRNHHNNPAMKVFNLNNKTQLSNFTTYYTDSNRFWNNRSYTAIDKHKPSIFKKCHFKTLALCLKTTSTKSLCKILNHDLFYGVMSNRVRKSNCTNTFNINL